MKVATETRPFHETIVEAIQRCASGSEIMSLAQLIEATTIPKGHDEIIAAIDKFFDFSGANRWTRQILEVKKSILKQKKASAEKSDKQKAINLDDLEEEAKKLLSLLENRQPGLMTWNGFMRERVESLHKLTSQALGK